MGLFRKVIESGIQECDQKYKGVQVDDKKIMVKLNKRRDNTKG